MKGGARNICNTQGSVLLKVKILKLGAMQNAEIDLRPLTILVGPNNTGKTWLAYTLAAIFGPRGVYPYVQAYAGDQLPRAYPPLDDAIEQLLTRGDIKIDLYGFAEAYGEEYFNNVAKFSSTWMSDFMQTQYSHFDNVNISITLDEMKAGFLQRIKASSFRRSISNKLLTMRKTSGEGIIYAYTSFENESNELITERLSGEDIKEFLISIFMTIVHQSLYPYVRVFPTERTAIVTFNFGNQPSRLRRQLSSLSDERMQEIQEQPLVEQIADSENVRRGKVAIGPVSIFMNMLLDIFAIGPKEIENRKKVANNDPRIQAYCDLADVLEKEILAGGIALSTTEPDPRRDIIFQPAQNARFEIAITSSMVKELSALVLYLRYLARPGELVVIDEPEMNLHPFAQVKMIELLAALVNAGLNILITTHSTYVVDHLGNLLDAYKHEKKDELVEIFVLGREDAFIDQNKVSVYEVTESGKVENILGSDGEINWSTFSDVTELIQRIHFEI